LCVYYKSSGTATAIFYEPINEVKKMRPKTIPHVEANGKNIIMEECFA
jgi:hypothetical protein